MVMIRTRYDRRPTAGSKRDGEAGSSVDPRTPSPVQASDGACRFAARSSSIRTIPSAPALHRVLPLARLAGWLARAYRRSGIAPCPEDLRDRFRSFSLYARLLQGIK